MDFFDSLIRMVSSLAIVLGLMLALAYAARRWYGGRGPISVKTPLVEVLGTGYLGPRKSVALVAVAGELLIIGSTADDLVPLGRVSDPETVRRLLNGTGTSEAGRPQDDRSRAIERG